MRRTVWTDAISGHFRAIASPAAFARSGLGSAEVLFAPLLSLFGRLDRPFLVPAKTALTPAVSALAQERFRNVGELVTAIDEASHRFGVPATWIEAVIAVESGGERNAVSIKGAMGLMQLMPATWRQFRADLGLGVDPFDRRDNVLAGAAYLRELYDRFGRQGFLAAYNAGPTRYQAYLTGAKRLPPETVAYVARIEARLADRGAAPSPGIGRPADWRAAGLFVERTGADRPRPEEATAMTILESADQERRP
ncbi:MAG: hypothetical protein B7Z12_11950 [Caulobacter vibrioides]|uniref:Transglycosylase SLT domain-containing protein n=1 Tax=Caulobacter vibrioides TaxID=155892 RepID=A0A258D570_CAUVI|nr:MAG: hypothetical protein B7Z12_11950 [Caulobacter vibrioides]